MSLLMERETAFELYDKAMTIIPKNCRICPFAISQAVDLTMDVERGQISMDEAERSFGLLLGSRCLDGVIELATDNYCIGAHQRFAPAPASIS